MTEIYFDNSSTTCPSDAVTEAVLAAMRNYGNPSSMHKKGMDAEAVVKGARDEIASSIGASAKEIYFTSGGTESNNWAIFGAARTLGRKGRKIITTGMEHASVLEPLAYMKKQGYEVLSIPMDESGNPDLVSLDNMLCDDVILVTTMLINNEIGTILPVDKIASRVRSKAPNAIIHADAVQAYGKIGIDVRDLGVDLISASGHKINGPKGTGFLYIRDGVRFVPLIFGGGQESGMRSGTENVPGIAGFGEAAREMRLALDNRINCLTSLRDRLEEGISSIEGSMIHAKGAKMRAPHILSAAFPGIRAEVLLHSLEARGIYISAGSACSTHKRRISPVMEAIGADKKVAESTVRFSFDASNTADQIDETIGALRDIVPMLLKYTRR